MPDALGDRMKCYEDAYRVYLPRRLPVIIRVDGRAFHTFTRGFKRPFDSVLSAVMIKTAEALCKEISGAKLAYIQSDEISILVTNDDTTETQPWFDNNLQKLASLSSSVATKEFNWTFQQVVLHMARENPNTELNPYMEKIGRATFDARAFILPPSEVTNYFIWRQQDATRNSIQMTARSVYSHKELQNKNTSDLQDMLMEKGINWNDYEAHQKRGACVVKEKADDVPHGKWTADLEIPIFTQDRDYIERRMVKGEEDESD